MLKHDLPNILTIQKIHEDDVKDAVFRALDQIEVKKNLMKDAMTILLKPNLLSDKPPERAVTTHPLVVKAVIEWLLQFNPKKIYVGDSSGGTALNTTERALKASGILAVCSEFSEVEALPLEKTERRIYEVPNSLVLKEIASTTLLHEVDLIINLPKIKTHGQCTLTCSIKNMFGTLLLGNKPRTHAQFFAINDFTAALTDIYSVSNPQLTLIDGYLCQEGNGPSAGDVVKMDLILAGYDAVALDTLVCNIIDLDPNRVLYLKHAEKKGLGSTQLSDYQILGEKVNDVKRPFKIPKIAPSFRLPKKMAEYISRTLFKSKISFKADQCKLCGTCWKNCPVQALSKPTNSDLKIGKDIPLWDSQKCITCYCCAELCPYEAIEFTINPAKNLLFSWVGISLLLIIILLIWFLIWVF